MKFYIQVSLTAVAVVFLIWTAGMLFAPELAHAVLSRGPYDHAVLSLFGACLFAVAAILLLTALHPELRMMYASEVCLALVAIMWGYQMLVGQGMPMNALTVLSFIVNVVAMAYVLLSISVGAMGMQMAMSHRGHRGARKKRR